MATTGRAVIPGAIVRRRSGRRMPPPWSSSRERLNNQIDDHSDLIVQGSTYSTFDEAAQAGRRWRQYLAETCARRYLAIDLGDDDASKLRPFESRYEPSPGNIFGAMGAQEGDRLIQDRIGLLVFDTDPKPSLIHFSAGVGSVSTGIDSFMDTLNATRAKPYVPWTDQQKLAFELVHSSLFDANPETRYIQLVTAIEALLPAKQEVPTAIADAMDKLIEIVDQLPDTAKSVRHRVKELLRLDKQESISRKGVQFTGVLQGEYGGTTPEKYFKELYGIRSNLVHGNQHRSSIDELNYRFSELVRFVLDLLEIARAEE
ncbi:hypothetical protein ACHIPZ_24870, partial [Antrihabitans sp. NCIMB 15449]